MDRWSRKIPMSDKLNESGPSFFVGHSEIHQNPWERYPGIDLGDEGDAFLRANVGQRVTVALTLESDGPCDQCGSCEAPAANLEGIGLDEYEKIPRAQFLANEARGGKEQCVTPDGRVWFYGPLIEAGDPGVRAVEGYGPDDVDETGMEILVDGDGEYTVRIPEDIGGQSYNFDQTFAFQNGAFEEVGHNGLTNEAVITILVDRLNRLNKPPYNCRENSLAITKLEEALFWLEARTKNRQRRGVEGTRGV